MRRTFKIAAIYKDCTTLHGMNFLAHLTLSCQDSALQMGNFLGDFTKGKPPAHYPQGILEGLRIHKLIDRTTDNHPAVKALNESLKTKHGRYAGVITDIVFDLYLYRHWDKFGPDDFEPFAKHTYQSIEQYLPLLDTDLAGRLRNMIHHQFLDSYRSETGILSVFNRMQHRMSKPELLLGLPDTLKEHDEAFNDTFLKLFPDLVKVVNDACGCQN